jgi:hypothetical protein
MDAHWQGSQIGPCHPREPTFADTFRETVASAFVPDLIAEGETTMLTMRACFSTLFVSWATVAAAQTEFSMRAPSQIAPAALPAEQAPGDGDGTLRPLSRVRPFASTAVSAAPALRSPLVTHPEALALGPPGAPASAERKGFLIGIGAGPALHRRAGFTVRNSAGTAIFSTPATSSFAVVTDFKIGYAPSDQILLYYVNKAAFTQDDSYDAVGLSGVGVTYMLRPTTPSAFFTGSIGAGAGRDLIETSDPESGMGFSFGAGFEFARHWSFDGDVVFVRLGERDSHVVFKGGINFLFY